MSCFVDIETLTAFILSSIAFACIISPASSIINPQTSDAIFTSLLLQHIITTNMKLIKTKTKPFLNLSFISFILEKSFAKIANNSQNNDFITNKKLVLPLLKYIQNCYKCLSCKICKIAIKRLNHSHLTKATENDRVKYVKKLFGNSIIKILTLQREMNIREYLDIKNNPIILIGLKLWCKTISPTI